MGTTALHSYEEYKGVTFSQLLFRGEFSSIFHMNTSWHAIVY